MQAYTEEQRKALAAEIVEQLVDCGSADDVVVERYNAWVFNRLSTIAPPVVAPAVPESIVDWVCQTCASIYHTDSDDVAQNHINEIRATLERLNTSAPAAPEVE